MRTKKEEKLESLSDDLKPIYEQFLADYQYCCVTRYGKAIFARAIIADLVRAGWRKTHEHSSAVLADSPLRGEKSKKTKKEEALESLSDDLKPIYEQFVAEYQYYCVARYGKAFVSPIIVADFIRAGWRPTHEPFIEMLWKKKESHILA